LGSTGERGGNVTFRAIAVAFQGEKAAGARQVMR